MLAWAYSIWRERSNSSCCSMSSSMATLASMAADRSVAIDSVVDEAESLA
jgi:hypothetical protein